jgi:hypothetical protein
LQNTPSVDSSLQSHADQLALFFSQARGCGHVKGQKNTGFDLVDMLPSRSAASGKCRTDLLQGDLKVILYFDRSGRGDWGKALIMT